MKKRSPDDIGPESADPVRILNSEDRFPENVFAISNRPGIPDKAV
jgi:hypothetical protein